MILKCCPFCGGEAIMKLYGTGIDRYYMIHCGNNCGALMTDEGVKNHPGCDDSLETKRIILINAWNKRTQTRYQMVRDNLDFNN
ncbi:MAG: Lar family restriction alleviation protein [Bacteroidales bacterium]|jgi:hypothetical protein|nr:Lar family restriction alleviation protein [Bacteroidales bacterium]